MLSKALIWLCPVSWIVFLPVQLNSQYCEQALTHQTLVVMASKKARTEVNQKYGRRIVDQCLSIWGTLNKAVVQDTSISSTVMTAKFPPSKAWQILTSMVEDENSSLANEHANKISKH